MGKKIGIVLIILTLFVIGGCGSKEQGGRVNGDINHVKLVVTKDFGTEEILINEIEYQPNMTVMDLLFAAELEVKAGYAGSFVDGINGLISKGTGLTGERLDWFYFVNGIFSDVGALDYFPEPGDVIWWDYRPWKMSGIAPTAVVGSFPQTFQYSYLGQLNPTYIMAYPEDLERAQSLKAILEELGVKQVLVIDVNESKIQNPEGPTILLGQWNLIKEIDYIEKLNSNYDRAGFYGFFSDNSLNLMDYDLKIKKRITEKAGLIIATGQGSGDYNPLWIVTGIDEVGFQEALGVLENNWEKLFKLYNAACLEGEVIGLPLTERDKDGE